MQKTAHQTYSFAEFTLDLTRGCLLRDTNEVKLRPKSFDVLKYLIENSGRLVSKDEVIDFVWRGMAVTDDSLVQCMKDIRRALGDDAQQIIKTVPRRGYIFEKEVIENGAAVYLQETSGIHLVIEETEETNGNGEGVRDLRSLVDIRKYLAGFAKRYKVASVTVSIILAGAIITAVTFANPLIGWWFKPPAVAVLPIVNTTGDKDVDYICDGLTESIITSLTQLNEAGRLPRLRVTALNTVFIFKGKEIDPRTVGRELGVETVLTAKMFHDAGLRTFKFEMINVADGTIVWRKQYSSGIGETLLETQNEIPRDVAMQLPISLSKADGENLTRRYTQNPEAYELYLKGRAEFRSITPSGLRKSIEYYQQALNLDSDFAAAYWAMGMSYLSEGNIDERSDREANEKATDLFQKALRIDNNLPVARKAFALIEANAWDWKAVEEAGPEHPAYDRYLAATGRLEEKLENEKQRLQNNPYAPFLNFTHCHTLLALRRADEAIAQCQKTLNIVPAANKAYFGPESPWIHLYLSLAYSIKETYPEAEAELMTAIELGENSKTLLAELGAVYAKSGQREKAFQILEKLREREGRGEYAPSLNISHVYIALGDKDQAFFWLNRAFDDRENRLVSIKFSDTYDPLREDPRFADLLRRMGLPS